MVQMPSNLAQSGLRIIIRLNVKEASLSIAVQVFVQQLANGELVNITALVRAEIFLNVGEASIAVDSRVDVSSFGSAIKLVALAIEYYHIVEIDEGHLERSAGLRLDGYVVWVDVGEVEPVMTKMVYMLNLITIAVCIATVITKFRCNQTFTTKTQFLHMGRA